LQQCFVIKENNACLVLACSVMLVLWLLRFTLFCVHSSTRSSSYRLKVFAKLVHVNIIKTLNW